MKYTNPFHLGWLLAAAALVGCSDAEDDTGADPLGAPRGSAWTESPYELGTPASAARVVINEVLAGASDDSSDWIELYNAGDEAVDLSAWRLTDDVDASPEEAWMLPADTWLAADEYLIVYASDGEGSEPDGLHASFKCSKGGETLVLYDGYQTVADQIDVEELDDDEAYARVADAARDWAITGTPTKGTAN